MAYTHSPYNNSMASHMMNNTHPQRRTSRSSVSQNGSHSYRIEKPWSNHNSPSVAERRRTTTGTKLYATLDDHYKMMMGIADDEPMEERFQPAQVRPVSWHPSSSHFSVQQQTQPQDWSRHYSSSSGNSGPKSDFYSLPDCNVAYAEPSYRTYPNRHQTHGDAHDSDSSYQTQPYTLSAYSTPAIEPMPWYLQEWARKNQEQTMYRQQGSAEFLPFQHSAEEQETDEVMGDSGKELVGMGLYDAPDRTEGWGSLVEATGKGLKLEETWQPPEHHDDFEEEAEDDASSDDGEEELPPPPQPAQQQPQQMHIPAEKPQMPNSMVGQSFFFEEDDSVTKEWWFQQLRQPSMPVRDAGIGYDWL